MREGHKTVDEQSALRVKIAFRTISALIFCIVGLVTIFIEFYVAAEVTNYRRGCIHF